MAREGLKGAERKDREELGSNWVHVVLGKKLLAEFSCFLP